MEDNERSSVTLPDICVQTLVFPIVLTKGKQALTGNAAPQNQVGSSGDSASSKLLILTGSVAYKEHFDLRPKACHGL